MKVETIAKGSIKIEAVENRVPSWIMPVLKVLIAATDGAIAAASFVLAFWIREGSPILSRTAWAWSQEFVPYAGILYAAVLIRVLMLVYERAYRFHGAFSYVQQSTKVVKAVTVGSLLIVSWAFLFRGGYAFRDFSYSRGVFVLDLILALFLYLTFHSLIRYIQTRFRARGINLIPTLVVGTNAEAVQTIELLSARRDLGYLVVAAVSGEGGRDVESVAGVPVAGSVEELASIVRRLNIQEVIITDDTVSSEDLFESMMRSGRSRRVEYRFAPKLFDLLPQKTGIEQIGVLPMVRLFREPLSDLQRLIKRASDLILAVSAILITLPLWVLSVFLVRMGSPGPILFRQERVGMDGRVFLCYKFRTMHSDSTDAAHREAYRQNIKGTADDLEFYGKVKDDPRVTRGGKILRRWSLDELPQFLNVIKGDMSVVGPRPPIPYEVEEYGVGHRKRLDMKPGITGLWQVSGRSGLSFEQMVQMDVYYIENWSPFLDLKIILLTVPAVLRGEGAQ